MSHWEVGRVHDGIGLVGEVGGQVMLDGVRVMVVGVLVSSLELVGVLERVLVDGVERIFFGWAGC